MLAFNILLDAPGEFGCLRNWEIKMKKESSLRHSIQSPSPPQCWNVAERMLGQLVRFWPLPRTGLYTSLLEVI